LTFFVDANVVLYAASRGEYRGPSLAILGAIAGGDAEGQTSVAVIEEVWHIERSGRAGPLDGLAEHAHSLFAPVLAVTDEVIHTALGLHAGDLGTNDRVHAATCIVNGISVIVTADRGFDAVPALRRIDPLDERALAPLLGGP